MTPPRSPSPPTPPSRAGSSSSEPFRLPRAVDPETYRIRLMPDLEALTFTGEVSIDVSVHEPVDELVLNSAALTIDEVAVDSGGARLTARNVWFDDEQERAHFGFAETLPPGPAVLRCRFAGTIGDDLRGFYRSNFVDEQGREQLIATTQLQATDARRAFPCWDEPDRKAVFQLTLVVPDHLVALSNAPVVAERPLDGARREVVFGPTMKMSTYLVAFIVGPLEASTTEVVDGTPVTIFAVPGKGHLTSFAAEIARDSLRFFTDYFAIDYPAEKLDLVAIPDFAAGAMENMGCVTFREQALLADPAQASRTELERVATTISHEIAHMWFGNLVTMRWWNGVWLNEAFATFMSVLCIDAIRPAWERWVSFALERDMALAVDGLHLTRPIEYPVGPPAEAAGMFDILTYEKGASVLRMLEQFLGPDGFREGVRRYLAEHAYANTETEDLWASLEQASGQPVRQVMSTWIMQGGYPVVEVDEAGTMTQRPFSYGPAPDGTESSIGGPWEIPMLTRPLEGDPAAGSTGDRGGSQGPLGASAGGGGGGGGADADADAGAGAGASAGAGGAGAGDGAGAPAPDRVLLGRGPLGAPGAAASANGEVPLLNAGGWGFYRVAYPATRLGTLGQRWSRLTDNERSSVVSDAWARCLAGELDVGEVLALGSHLDARDDLAAWAPLGELFDLSSRAVPDADQPAVGGATRRLFAPVAGDLGWDRRPGDDDRTATTRALVLRLLGTIGDDRRTRDEAARRLRASWEHQGAQLDPNIESAILEIVAADGHPADFDAYLERYRRPATPQSELRYLGALATFPDVSLGRRAFDLALGEVRPQNAYLLIARLFMNRSVGPDAWTWVEAAWDDITGDLPVNTVVRLLESARWLCARPALAERVTLFLGGHLVREGERTIRQTLERLSVNRAFAARQGPVMGSVLTTWAVG